MALARWHEHSVEKSFRWRECICVPMRVQVLACRRFEFNASAFARSKKLVHAQLCQHPWLDWQHGFWAQELLWFDYSSANIHGWTENMGSGPRNCCGLITALPTSMIGLRTWVLGPGIVVVWLQRSAENCGRYSTVNSSCDKNQYNKIK